MSALTTLVFGRQLPPSGNPHGMPACYAENAFHRSPLEQRCAVRSPSQHASNDLLRADKRPGPAIVIQDEEGPVDVPRFLHSLDAPPAYARE